MSTTKKDLGYSFVFVINKENPKAGSKKLILPHTFQAFLKAAAKVLNLPKGKEINSVYNEDNDIVTNLDGIENNQKLFVSTEIDENTLKSSNEIAKENLSMSQFNSPSQVRFNPPTQSPRNQIGFAAGSRNPSALGLTQGSRNPSALGLSQGSRNQSSFGLAPGSPLMNAGSNGFRPPSTLQSRPNSRAPSSLLILTDNDPNSPSRLKKRKNTGLLLEETDAAYLENENDDRRFEKTGVSFRAIESLLSFLPREIIFSNDGTDSLVDSLSSLLNKFSTNVKNFQQVQETFIFHTISENVLRIPPHFTALDNRANEIINNGTMGSSCGTFTKLRSIIMGPVQGGKTVFLKILANAYLLRLISSGQYKRTLFYYIDFKEFANVINNPIEFYNSLIRVTFEQISNQHLQFQAVKDNMITYFHKLIITPKVPALPQNFVLVDEFHSASLKILELAQNIHDCFHKDHSLDEFLIKVVMLPHNLAAAFGYSNVQFFADHINIADVDISPIDQLNRDNHSEGLIKYLKLMFSYDGFVLSCTNEKQFAEFLSTEEGDIDLLDESDIISITDMDVDGHSDEFEFVLIYDDQIEPLILRLSDCGGCSGFLVRWDEIVEMTEKLIEEKDKDSESKKVKEIRLFLLKRFKELVPLIFHKVDQENETSAPLDVTIRNFGIRRNETTEFTRERE